jgi:hypothetical protein
MEHDSLSIVQGILEKEAVGEELSTGRREFAEIVADYLNSSTRWMATG